MPTPNDDSPQSPVTLHARAPRFRPTGADRAPTSEEPAPIKMTNQQTKLDQATPVRTMATVHSPVEPRVRK